MPQDYARQPWKTFFLLHAAIKLLALIPLWFIKDTFPDTRLHPLWSFRRSFLLRPFQYVAELLNKAGNFIPTPDHRKVVHGKGYTGVWVEGAPQLVKGSMRDWATKAATDCVAIPGYWTVKPGTQVLPGQRPTASEKIIYYVHGGGYITWSAHPESAPACNISQGLLDASPNATRVFSIEYRLCSTTPFEPVSFPTPLIDALAGYNYLINVIGCSPSNVVVAGDSAGAHLALALMRYLIEYKIPNLSVPAGLVLLSPFCDLNMHPPSPSCSLAKYTHTDIVNHLMLHPGPTDQPYIIRSIVGNLGYSNKTSSAYLSPAAPELSEKECSFHGFPKTLITAGGLEVLLDQIRVLRDRMTAQVGAKDVLYVEQELATHDCILYPWHEPERSELLRTIGDWIARL